jgi:hypothetical protein
MANIVFFVLLNTNRKRNTHTQINKIMSKKNEKRKIAFIYIQKKKTYTVKIINKEIFVCIDVDD